MGAEYAERANEGLPTADEYDPESIGTCQLEAGESVQTYPQYGLEMVPVIADGEDTGKRIVRRNGDYIATVSDRYKLLPNEQAVEAANEVAQRLDARPFHQFDGDWFVQLDDHVYQDPDRRRVHAAYAWESRNWGDEDLEYGFIVHNSIDTSLRFNVSLFSFRHACANMVTMGISQFPERVEQERQVLASDNRKHTTGFDVDLDSLQARIESTLMVVDHIDEAYQQWADEILTPDVVLGVIERLPAKDLPSWITEDAGLMDQLDRFEENEGLDTYTDADATDVNAIVESAKPADETTWDFYNDLTESIWHDDATNDSSKNRKFDKLHRAIAPSQYVG